MNFSPERIVCLTEETTETLYLLGEQDRIVGISGFTVRPKQARKEKPKVSAFIDAKIDKILELKPDLVIGFSDIQANIAKALIEKGVNVWINNHRSVEEIFKMIIQLGALVNQKEKAIELVIDYKMRIEEINSITNAWTIKPKVYFEEWYDPIITGIKWVSEIIELAGGNDVFPTPKNGCLAKNRIIKPKKVIEANPDIILASWCGKKFKKKKMLNRKNWEEINAIKQNEIYEIDSSIILQPGPASISEGIEIMHSIFQSWCEKNKINA